MRSVRELTAGRYTGIATAVILLSWLGFAFLPQHGTAHTPTPTAGHMHGMNHANMAPMAAPVTHQPALWMAIVSWVIMTIAMMGPAALPAIQYVERHTLRWRGRATVLYTVVWLALWVVFGIAVTLGLPLAAGVNRRWMFAGALLFAGIWQLTPMKRQALGDCHRSAPLPSEGWPAIKGLTRFGAFSGWACIRSCWAVMLAMALAPSAHILWMVPLTAAVTYERFTQRPGRTVRVVAVLFVITAAAVGMFAAIQ
ncbi:MULTISPECIES: DUF2182 domain-containing protein [unclassified Mycobacteroides]|uniref:DUF2182 domain-containing protein n=1 Tax=unclassified Mycobacteroides TaxID=2618759 RepID=UPI0013280456|nr:MULTISPECIES: DUF2182 domain-containing protein [unclassified Mycobacteroides]MUM17202.1 hypothetical protein [Mycobacteroides sp. CBMA 326]